MQLFSLTALCLMALGSINSYATNINSLDLPRELAASQIEDKAGASIPLDVEVTNQDNQTKKLGSYFTDADKRPIIATFLYYGCPMLCSLVLNGLIEGLKGLNLIAGKDYRLLSFSIDEREKPDLAKAKQAAYLGALEVKDPSAWIFHVMKESEARRLSDAVGFNYAYHKDSDQFAHGAGVFIISPKGVLSRTLYGISFKPNDLKFALTEAADGKIGSVIDRVLLSCFHYDPDSQRYGIYIFGVMRLGGVLTILIVGIFLAMNFLNERKRIKSLV